MSLGRALRIVRAIRNVSQKEVCGMADISTAYFSEIERGIRRPSPKLRAQLCSHLRVEPRLLAVLELSPEELSVLTPEQRHVFGRELLLLIINGDKR